MATPTAVQGLPTREGAQASFQFQVPEPAQGRPTISADLGPATINGQASQITALAPGGQFREAAELGSQTLKALSSLTQGAIEPLVQQEQQHAYWEGVKAAASGTAIKEILEEQPWYSQIFGDSALVQGARAYTAQKNITDALTEFGTRMEDLRKLDPDAAAGEIIGLLDRAMTDDPTTNLVIQKAAMESLPTLLKQQAKEHYGWRQSELRQAQFGAWTTNSGLLQSKAKGFALGTVSQEDMEVERNRFLQNLAPLDGQSEESYKANLIALATSVAQEGNFYALQELDRAGLRGMMTPEQAKSLEDTVFRYKSRAKAQVIRGEMGVELGLFDAAARTGVLTPDQIAAAGERFNEQFRKLTGIEDDYLVDIRQSVATSAVKLYESQTDNSDLRRAQSLALAEAGFLTGAGKGAIPPRSGASEIEISQAFRQAVAQVSQEDPSKAHGLLVSNAVAPLSYIDPVLQGQMQNGVLASLGAQYNQGFENSYQAWKQLRATPNGGIRTASMYYGDVDTQLSAYDSQLQAGVLPEIAFQNVFVERTRRAPPGDKVFEKKLSSAISSQFKSFWPWVDDPAPATIEMLSNQARAQVKEIQSVNPYVDIETATQQAVAQLQAKGLELHGKWGWMRLPESQPLTDLVGSNARLLDRSVNSVLESRLKAIGVSDVQSFQIIRGPDQAGQAKFLAQVWDGEDTHSFSFTSDDLQAEYTKSLEAWVPPVGFRDQRQPNVPIELGGGAVTYFR